jgi:hypothetical protein
MLPGPLIPLRDGDLAPAGGEGRAPSWKKPGKRLDFKANQLSISTIMKAVKRTLWRKLQAWKVSELLDKGEKAI